MKNRISFGLALALILVVGQPIAMASSSLVEKKFSNCAALNEVYPGGVAKSSKVKNQGGKTRHQPKVDAKIYEANKTKDRDKDGIACEK